MRLVIAEKPSVAQSLAKVIGATKRGDGYLEGNGYLVSWCVGHLVELSQPDAYEERYAKWKDESWLMPYVRGYEARYMNTVSALLQLLAGQEKYDELQEQANASLKIIPQNTDVYYWMLTASYHKGELQYLKRELNVISGVLSEEECAELKERLQEDLGIEDN